MSEAWVKSCIEQFGSSCWPLLFEALRDDARTFTARIAAPTDEDQTSQFFPQEKSLFGSKCFGQPGAYTHKSVDYFLDPASIAPVAALGVQKGDTVLDLCAAPGGKSLLLASELFGDDCAIGGNTVDSRGSTVESRGNSGVPILTRPQLVCNDASQGRSARLRQVMRSHYPEETVRVQVVTSDPTASLGRLSRYGPYDRILLDAPCSSDRHRLQNTLETDIYTHVPALDSSHEPDADVVSSKRTKETRSKDTRKKETRQKAETQSDETLASWKEGGPKGFAKTQLKLLEAAAAMLKWGGRLVYSTCALSPHENDGVIAKFLAKNTGFTIRDCEFKDAHFRSCVSFVNDYDHLAIAELQRAKIAEKKQAIDGNVEEKEGNAEEKRGNSEEKEGERCKELKMVARKTQCGYLILPDIGDGCGPIFFSVLEKTKKLI